MSSIPKHAVHQRVPMNTLDAALQEAFVGSHKASQAQRRMSALMLSVDTPWTIHDKGWFERHKTRSHRLRRVFLDEVPPELVEQGLSHVVVRQLSPGERDKLFVGDPSAGEILDELVDQETTIAALWRRLDGATSEFTLSDVLSDARQLANLIGNSRGQQ